MTFIDLIEFSPEPLPRRTPQAAVCQPVTICYTLCPYQIYLPRVNTSFQPFLRKEAWPTSEGYR